MLTIVIVNYKNEKQTIHFVLKELKCIECESIIVVNNGATEESSTILCEKLSAVRVDDIEKSSIITCNRYVIHVKENKGFAVGNNIGAEFARLHFKPQYILFTNTDIHLQQKNVAEKLVHILQNKKDVGIVGPKIIGLDGRLQSPEPYIPFWHQYVSKPITSNFWTKEKKGRILKTDYAENAKEGYVDKVMGSFFLVDAQAFYNCGMMDPYTFLYYEELILTERMKNIGKKVYYYPNVSVIHEHATTIKKHYSMLKMEKLNFQSAQYYYHVYKQTPLWKIKLGKILYFTFWNLILLKEQFR